MNFPLVFPYNWRYPLRTWYKNIAWIWYWIRDFFQRGANGFAWSDTWSTDNYLMVVIPEMIKHLKETRNGHPNDITNEEWGKELDIMIEGFEALEVLDDLEYDWENDNGDVIKNGLEKKWKEGSTLFIEKFRALWD